MIDERVPKIIPIQKRCPHPSIKTQFNHLTLLASIKRILIREYNQDQINMILQQLKQNTKDGLDTVNIFKNPHENDRNVHCHILAIMLYLGIYQIENRLGQNEFIHDKKMSNFLSKIQ